MKIWLDDIRDAPDDTWAIVRDVTEAGILLLDLERLGLTVEVMSFDHDLGENGGTGYNLLNSIERWAAWGWWQRIPKRFEIHSANPVGRKNMQAAIDSIERMRSDFSS